MTDIIPDNWVVIKIMGPDPHYKVLAGWSGGYTQGSSWSLNSGITAVEETDKSFKFTGCSGSVYNCGKESYGLKMSNAYVWNRMKEKFGDTVEIMPEDTDWSSMDWILK